MFSTRQCLAGAIETAMVKRYKLVIGSMTHTASKILQCSLLISMLGMTFPAIVAVATPPTANIVSLAVRGAKWVSHPMSCIPVPAYLLLRCASTNGGSVLVVSEVPVQKLVSWQNQPAKSCLTTSMYALVRCASSNADMAVSIVPATCYRALLANFA